jgi:hypothetical protein
LAPAFRSPPFETLISQKNGAYPFFFEPSFGKNPKSTAFTPKHLGVIIHRFFAHK